MNPIANIIENWHYADGYRRDLTFEGGRTMIVVAASAYNAGGIIGSEYNGLVVIDADNNSIVLRNHLRDGGGMTPTLKQSKEFERVTNMAEWPDFAAWLKATPGYLGGVPDIDAAVPVAPSEVAIVLKAANARTVPGLPGDDILSPELRAAHDAPGVPYTYPLRTRLDMAAFIAGHATHGERFHSTYLAWDIKVGGADMSGKVEGGDTEVDPDLDLLWQKYADRNGEQLFWDACRDGIRSYVEGEATTYPGDDQGDFVFETQGRSGGWLVLKEWRGLDFGFGSRAEMVERLLEMKHDELAALYAAVVCFDQDIKPELIFTHNMAMARARVEENWSTPEMAEAAAEELGLDSWTHPSRASAPAPA